MAEDQQNPTLEVAALKGPSVYLSGDRTEILLDCPDPLANLYANVEKILAAFEDLDLPDYPGRNTLEKMLRGMAEPGQDLESQALIRGKKPVPPVHADLKWAREYFAIGWVIDQTTDTIDFREKVSNCSVRRNELLGRRFEPVDGEGGKDVYGNPIPAVKAETMHVRCGKGVVERSDEGVTSYFAEIDGRITFKDNTVTVDEVYAITGDVDLKSGNIHHTGSITISGDIRNGARVEADGDIVVKGLVEQCTIRCGGNLIVAGGIIGDEKHTIEVGGNLEARYIKDADIRADGDILVVREITHSHIRTQGAIKVPRGRIAGGECVALGGICVATAGAPSGAHTTLRAGVDYSLAGRIEVFLEKISRLEASLAPVETALKNAENSHEEYSDAINKVIEDLAEKRMLIGQSITLEYMRIEELTVNTEELAVPYVVMTEAVWSGTNIYLGDSHTKVPRSIPKPRLATLKDTRARVVPLGESNWPDGDLCE